MAQHAWLRALGRCRFAAQLNDARLRAIRERRVRNRTRSGTRESRTRIKPLQISGMSARQMCRVFTVIMRLGPRRGVSPGKLLLALYAVKIDRNQVICKERVGGQS